MVQRFWNGREWKRISNVEARFRRARGQEVVDGEPPTAGVTVTEVVITMPGVASAPLTARVAAREVTSDLTDDELERLTAPGGEG